MNSDRSIQLAILAVYMFDKSMSQLARLHLDQIAHNTKVPHTIYGVVDRLNAPGRRLLAEYSDVFQFVSDVLGQKDRRMDHHLRLSAARQRAADDGATHFVTLHVDSFPICPDWVEKMLQRLDSGAAFACVEPYCYNACLFWGKEWEQRGLSFLPSEEERSSDAFSEFLLAHPHLDRADGGIGFLYGAWREGLRWYGIEQTAPNIWGDLVLHLVGATRLTSRDEAPAVIPKPLETLKNALRPALRMLPRSTRTAIYQSARRRFVLWDQETIRDGSPRDKLMQIQALVENPERFIRECRQFRSKRSDRLEGE